jgi:anti-sigma factor RsiW
MSDQEALEGLRCEDVAELGPLYVDGELEGDERAAIDRHAGACASCAEHLAEQTSWKGFMRQQAGPIEAPAALRAKVLAALDAADGRGLGPRPPVWRQLAPVLALVGVAAAAVLFLSTASRSSQSPVGAALVADAVKAHERNLPVEVGGDPDHVEHWMQGKVSVPVQPPRLAVPRYATRRSPGSPSSEAGATQASLVGGRLSSLSGYEAAQLTYRVQLGSGGAGDQQVSLYVFDARKLAGVDLDSLAARTVRGHTVYVAQERGYRVAIGLRDDGVGFALASAAPEGELVGLLGEVLEANN